LDGNKASCEIRGTSGKLCGQIIKRANFASNLKYHLDKCHPDIGAEIRSAEKNRVTKANVEKKSGDHQQQTLVESFSRAKPYGKNSSEENRISRALGLFLGGTTVSISIVNNPLFQNFMLVLDSR